LRKVSLAFAACGVPFQFSINQVEPDHSSTVFRVRLDNLKPQTTYYYTVDSMEASGKSDGARSPVKHFTPPS